MFHTSWVDEDIKDKLRAQTFQAAQEDQYKGRGGAMLNPKLETRIIDPLTGGEKGSKLCQLGDSDPLALTALGEVNGYGAQKYSQYNWAKGYKWSLSYNALQRHLMLFWGGENRDMESGMPHLAHAAWHCLVLLSFMLRGRGTDDRFPS